MDGERRFVVVMTGVGMICLMVLSVTDVAVQLGVCRQTVYNYIYYEGLPSMLLRGVRRVHPDSLQEWLKSHEVA